MGGENITILRILQANTRARLEDISYETGLSVATVQRRIRAMKESGLISREVAIVEPKLAGYPLSILIMVELERERLDQIDAFRRKVKAEAQVQQCYYLTGQADFALIVLARDMQDYEKMTHRMFFDDSNVKRFQTSVVMDRTKVSMDVPLI